MRSDCAPCEAAVHCRAMPRSWNAGVQALFSFTFYSKSCARGKLIDLAMVSQSLSPLGVSDRVLRTMSE